MFFSAIPEGDIEKKFNTAPIFFTATKCKQRNNLAISFPKKNNHQEKIIFSHKKFWDFVRKIPLAYTHTPFSVFCYESTSSFLLKGKI